MALKPLLEVIAGTCLRHQMFRTGSRVGVAVSGGPDSVFLLHALLELAPRWDLSLSVIHLDHGLRGDASRADAEFVRTLAERLGLPFFLEQAALLDCRENLEQAARTARLKFFARLVTSGSVDRVATGHTQSDQAETVLQRVLRGSGTGGLAGILPVTAEGLVRPLLAVSRADAADWLRDRGIEWRIDETNLDRRFQRNRIRLDLLPVLREQYNPSVDEELARTAELAREEDAFLEEAAGAIAARAFTQSGKAIVVENACIRSQSIALQRRLVRRAMAAVRGDLRQIEFLHVERVLELVHQNEGHGRMIAPGVDVMRSFDWLRFVEPGAHAGVPRIQIVPLQVPGETPLPAGDGVICTRLRKTDCQDWSYNGGQKNEDEWVWLDWEKVRGPVQLRYWLPGDQYRPADQDQPEKLKQMFQRHRIPLWERRFWPIIENGSGIMWARQFGPGHSFGAVAGTRMVLELREKRN